VDARLAVLTEHNRKARESLFGVPWDITMQTALSVPQDERRKQYEAAWSAGGATPMLVAYVDLLVDENANATVADFVRGKIRGIVKNPAVAALLSPNDHPLGTKRICVDTNYYDTYNRDNVTLCVPRARTTNSTV
jgi:cyclohexanone monooxygenase